MERDDFELIHRTLSGDEAAFSELVQKYQKSVHALAWRKIGDFHIAEEITQDTFLQAHKKLASLKNPNQFAGWLYVIADRRCKAWFRKKKLWTQSLEATSVETLEKAAYADYVCEQREETAVECRREIVQKLMEKLPESERTVMVLHYLGEMSCEAISRFLGVSPNTVKSRLRRARERLKNEEHIIRETLGSVPLSPNLTENIMRNIDTIKQTSPSGGKPLLPFAALGATAILVILLMGASKQFTANFQKPYSVDAKSEPTIEIVDAPVVLNIQSKPELQNRVGGTNRSKNSNNGLTEGTEKVENNLTQDAMQWNLPEDAKARLGKGHIDEIQYSPDGTILAVASGIGIWLYDTTTHQEVALLTEHTSAVSNIAFSPDGRFFASGSNDDTIILWDRSRGEQKTLTVHKSLSSIYALTFSPNSKTLASGSGDTIQFWDTTIGEHKDTLTGLPEFFSYFSFGPGGKTIVSVTWEGEVCISDVITGNPKKTFTVKMTDSVFCVAFSPDGKIVAIGSRDGTIYLSDLTTGELERKLTGHSINVQSIAFSPNGKTLISSSYLDETLRIWDVHTGELKRTLTEHTGELWGLAFSPDGKTFASSGSGDGTIRLWDAHTGKQLHIITRHTDWVSSVSFTPDGKLIACGYEDGTIRFWDADTRHQIKTFNGFKGTISSLVFTSDGKTLVSGGDDGILWDVHTGKQKLILSGHTNETKYIHCIALSADGKTLASGGEDKTIRLWDMSTGELKKTLKEHKQKVYSVTFSPDGKTLVSGNEDHTILLWDVGTGETKMTFNANAGDPIGRKSAESVSISPDGKTLASAAGTTVIHLWDIDTGKSKMTLAGHRYGVSSLVFSPDGKTLASGSTDNDIRLWDVRTGEHKKTLSGHTDCVNDVAFSPDGKILVSGSQDGSVLIWEIDP
ncbi:MAG: sigma-70 family RNA polymerase sigma factor [Candidatus Poribacteria bacterium]|nr:sigma-70 family RNA polymerase sigma factor [Candidatus Poribacteria bacterium]